MDSIKVKAPLWGGYKIFSWEKKEPFIGLSENKLIQAGDVVEIDLEYLRTVVIKNKSELIRLAEENNWRGRNGRLPCYYFPESIITGCTEKIKARVHK